VRGIDYLATRSSYWLLVMLAMAFAGCTSYTPVAESTSEEPTVVVPAPEPIETPPQDPEPHASVPAPPRLPPIAIVLTNSQPAYLDVAVELANYFADHTVYDLSNESIPPVTVLRSINDTQVTAVVAIGLRAAQSAVAMAEAPVVFSQVFNHQDHELLGQPAPTLSGGEAQRIKLSRELSKIATGRTIYILDEPSVGLHSHDVAKLILALNKLVDKGNTVIIIEHNLDIIKVADHLIDLGPEGGNRGGEIIAEGTPEEVARVAGSYTGQFLKEHLNGRSS
jgi:hypothetical protein